MSVHSSHLNHIIASLSEEEIEAELRASLARGGRSAELLRDALNRIDDLQAKGAYEAERVRLQAEENAERRVLASQLDTLNYTSIWEAIASLEGKEPAKKARERPRGRYYPGDAALLREMKRLVRGGDTVPVAAAKVAGAARGSMVVQYRQERLENAFREKMASPREEKFIASKRAYYPTASAPDRYCR